MNIENIASIKGSIFRRNNISLSNCRSGIICMLNLCKFVFLIICLLQLMFIINDFFFADTNIITITQTTTHKSNSIPSLQVKKI